MINGSVNKEQGFSSLFYRRKKKEREWKQDKGAFHSGLNSGDFRNF